MNTFSKDMTGAERRKVSAMKNRLPIAYCTRLLGGLILTCGVSSGHALLAPGGGPATAADYESSPPQIVQGADPFLMISLSVELTQQAEAFTDGPQTYKGGTVCTGRNGGRGICFSSAEKYIGYFDPEKCYVYSNVGTALVQRAEGPYSNGTTPHFAPKRMATNRACGGVGEFSGNFLNWATMTALDQFRSAMTGGARLVDEPGADNAKTLLTRTYRYGDWDFVDKRISTNGINGFATPLSNVVPPAWAAAGGVTLDIINDFGNIGNQVRFVVRNAGGNAINIGGTTNLDYAVAVRVCDVSVGLEANCVRYSNGTDIWYKPEGLLQKNALKMRYALNSYSAQSGNGRNGGILRANAKYIGYLRPTSDGGVEVNLEAEIAEDGTTVSNPDGVSLADGVVNSGVLNYINQFGLAAGRYKSNDPVAELYYEGLRYMMNLGRTPSFSAGLSNANKDGYPLITAWTDPITNSCQKNYALYVGDQFAHQDDYLPGQNCGGTECDDVPGSLNANTLTNLVGTKEGFFAGTLGNQTRGRGDGYWIAGLSYWANVTDIRPDIEGQQRVKTFMVDTQEFKTNPPVGRNNQLWLAAKYGGFNNLKNHTYNSTDALDTEEWDADGDGKPDAYTLASQPEDLVAGLTQAFNEVLEKSSSASAAAVVANASRGTGAIYQAIYEPRLGDGNVAVTWSGLLRGLFIDDDARIREDSNGNATLDATDYVVTFVKDESTKVAVAQLRDPATNAIIDIPGNDDDYVAVRDVKSIWDARDVLSLLTDTQVVLQRGYTDSAASGRHIFTWVDADGDGAVNSTEVLDFEQSVFADYQSTATLVPQNARLLGLTSASGADDAAINTEAEKLVNYIRGLDISGWRNRTIDLGDGKGSRTLRLGDIVHSAPLVIGAPFENYDLIYGDNSYRQFKQHYRNRRQVVYAGANDGMLHAFNAGFFDSASSSFLTSVNGAVAHPLGSELWAYVPYNLLPHLQWLKALEYPHIYYVDGAPQAFDVNIFPDDADHPGGWGTILVVGFRMGGGDISVDTLGDGNIDTTLRSAYVVLDITNPEKAPELLAEISNPELGFTTSKPTVVKRRVASNGSYANPATNQWYLVFGSGPSGSDSLTKRQALQDAVSDQDAKLFVYDLKTRNLVDFDGLVAGPQPATISGQTNAFVGSLVHADWNRDYSDEVIYFGTVGGTVNDPTGALFRWTIPDGGSFSLSGSNVDVMLTGVPNGGQPFSSPPLLTKDTQGRAWVAVGSGRFFTASDVLTSKQMTYYGIREPVTGSGQPDLTASVARSSLADVTDVIVRNTGAVELDTDGDGISDGSPIIGGQSVSNYPQFTRAMNAVGGWYFDAPMDTERFVDRTLQTGSTLVFIGYEASDDSCDPQGESNLYARDLLTGTPPPFAPLGLEGNSVTQVAGSIDLGFGQYFLSGLHTNKDGQTTVITTGSSADLESQLLGSGTTTNSRMSWRELPLED
jgi:type IV pilus assembly protein PilY1